MAVPVISGPLEGARATGARPNVLVWLERAAPRRGEPRARVHAQHAPGRHLYRLRDGALWYVGHTDAKCAACNVDHRLYGRAGRHESCAWCGGRLVAG